MNIVTLLWFVVCAFGLLLFLWVADDDPESIGFSDLMMFLFCVVKILEVLFGC